MYKNILFDIDFTIKILLRTREHKGVYMIKKIKAEMWDKVQYIFKNYYDGMMHCAFEYEGIVDAKIMSAAIKQVVDKVDVLHSSFVANPISPYWKVNYDYTEDDVLTVVEDDDFIAQIQKILTRKIDCKGKLQFEFTLLHGKNRSMLCFLINHMCFDGRDFISFGKTICETYNGLKQNPDYKAKVKTGSRSAKQVYNDLPPELAKKAKMLYKNVSLTNIKLAFPFDPPADTDKSHIMKVDLEAEALEKAKARGKREGYTVNDIYLAAFFRAIAKYFKNVDESTPAEITSMMDLRRYIKGNDTAGFTNLTSYMPCKMTDGVGKDFEDTLKRVAKTLKPHKENPLLGLSGLPLMAFAFQAFPFAVSQIAVKLGYTNPLVGMSNIGIIKSENVDLIDCPATGAFMTGTVKYKPYMQVACTTFKGKATFTISERCSKNDIVLMREFLEYMTGLIRDYGEEKI